MLETSQLGTIAVLKILKKLETALSINLAPVSNQLDAIEIKIDAIPTTDLSTVNAKLDQLLQNSSSPSPSSSGITFTAITLNPTYQVGSNYSNGWLVTPQNLPALYDGDTSSASNQFKFGGLAWAYGEVVLFPGVSIPQLNRIQFKVGLGNTGNQRSLFELAVFSVSKNDWINVWSYAENVSSSNELIANIDIIIPYVWDKIRFRLWDIGQQQALGRFYDLKVFEVS